MREFVIWLTHLREAGSWSEYRALRVRRERERNRNYWARTLFGGK